MSVHPSLRSPDKGKQHRSIWKRFERIRKLKKEDKWDEEEDSVFGLPKLKIIKAKIKKHKAAVEKEAAPEVAEAVNAPGEEAAQEAKPEEKKEKRGKEEKKK